MKKGLFITLALVPVVWAFTAMTKPGMESAVGSTKSLPLHLQEAFSISGFDPIPEPGSGDWLASQNEPGQTYAQFVKTRPLKPGAQGRKFIYLQPLGDFPKEAPQMTVLQEYLAAYFYPMEVKLAKALPIDESKIGARIASFSGEKQWNATDLLNGLQRRVPRDAYVVMAVTMTDLYPSEEWNFVFGLARIQKRVGVFSFARYDVKDEPKLALERAFKVISHETGHAFGIKHCIHFHCLMNGSNGLGETDRAPLHLCPACLRKIHWGLNFDPSERYRKIEQVLEAQKMDQQAEWFSARARKTESKR
ncbi:MAG: archaemetzincin [Akkermansiaceae bacterium]